MIAFLPSLVFFLMAPLSVSLALWLGFAAAFAVGIHAFGTMRVVRVFDFCGLVLFGALALYTGFVQSDFGPAESALVLDAGFLAAILYSMAARRPFTTQYHWLTAEHPPEVLVRAHTLMTALWASAYAAMGGICAISVVEHRLLPVWAGILELVIFLAALTFTWRFGAYIDKRGGHILFLRRR